MSEDKDTQEAPIVTYSNRIQKILERLTFIMSQTTDTLLTVRPLRMMIRNFPPNGKEYMKEELKTLKSFEDNVNTLNAMQVEEIYEKAHDWFYIHVLQDAFRFRPRNPKPAHIGSGGGMRADE